MECFGTKNYYCNLNYSTVDYKIILIYVFLVAKKVDEIKSKYNCLVHYSRGKEYYITLIEEFGLEKNGVLTKTSNFDFRDKM